MNTPMYGLTNPNGNQTKPNTPTQQNNVYNNKLNSKLVGSVPSLMDYEYSLPMNTQFYERKANIANRLVLYHACFAVPNAKTASLCGDVLRLFCDHELSSCKLFCTLPCLFCSNELNCRGFYSLPCLMYKMTLWPYSNCIQCPFTHSFTGTKTYTANDLVLYNACFAVPNETTVKHMVLYYTVLRFICNHETQQLQIYLVLYAACLAVTNSTINCSVLYLAWWTKWLWKLCPYSRCICCQNAQFYTNTDKNCQPAGTVPCVFWSTRCKNCKPHGALLKLFCNHEPNSCKLLGTVPCLFRSKELNYKLFSSAFTEPCLMDSDGLSNCGCCGHVLSSFTVHKFTVLHNQKQQLPTGWYCTMHVLPHQIQQQ